MLLIWGSVISSSHPLNSSLKFAFDNVTAIHTRRAPSGDGVLVLERVVGNIIFGTALLTVDSGEGTNKQTYYQIRHIIR